MHSSSLLTTSGLKQHLLVAEVETMERALRLGNAYFQADSACWPGTTIQQVGADDDVHSFSRNL